LLKQPARYALPEVVAGFDRKLPNCSAGLVNNLNNGAPVPGSAQKVGPSPGTYADFHLAQVLVNDSSKTVKITAHGEGHGVEKHALARVGRSYYRDDGGIKIMRMLPSLVSPHTNVAYLKACSHLGPLRIDDRRRWPR
jgi:hypothetical protein